MLDSSWCLSRSVTMSLQPLLTYTPCKQSITAASGIFAENAHALQSLLYLSKGSEYFLQHCLMTRWQKSLVALSHDLFIHV